MHVLVRSPLALALLLATQPAAAQPSATPSNQGGMDPALDVRCYLALAMTERGNARSEPIRAALSFYEGRITARHDAAALEAAMREAAPSLRRADNVRATATACVQYQMVTKLIVGAAARGAGGTAD